MNTQPGWYDAGVPGRERWWDGTQWTAHEREIAVVPAVPAQQVVQPQQAVQPQHASAARSLQMGWYQVPGRADVRWWDGAMWTPYRIRDGKPRADALSVEPPSTGVTLGIVFIVLAITQLGLNSLSDGFNPVSVLFLVVGAIWLIGGVSSGQVRKLPAPQSLPVFDAASRPLPGEVEGPGAGWYPVSGRVTRWWTGARWSWYVGQKYGVRPGYAGPRGYLVSMIAGWILAGLGVLTVLGGIALIGAVGTLWGISVAIVGAFLVLMGGLILLLIYYRRYAMILPPEAPRPR